MIYWRLVSRFISADWFAVDHDTCQKFIEPTSPLQYLRGSEGGKETYTVGIYSPGKHWWYKAHAAFS